MRYALFAFALFIVPTLALAAGFAKQSLFLSRTDVTEGATVLLYATVNNESPTKFDGGLSFYDADAKIGAVPVTLTAGEAQTASVSWKPLAGKRTVTAKLVAKDGTVAETLSETFIIKEIPKPAATSSAAAVVESSQGIQDQITNLSPVVGNTTAPVFTLIDSARSSAADLLDGQIAQTKKRVGGDVLGQETQVTPSAAGNSAWSILWTVYLYILTALRFLIGNAGLFYPALAIVFLFFMYRMFRRFRRPAY